MRLLLSSQATERRGERERERERGRTNTYLPVFSVSHGAAAAPAVTVSNGHTQMHFRQLSQAKPS